MCLLTSTFILTEIKFSNLCFIRSVFMKYATLERLAWKTTFFFPADVFLGSFEINENQ